ncbi:uncharacterized protein LOC122513553 [Polistes fuscatus]|uniref:uncharacterized protein LOC122513553 n=1 Tax=Polistes fuscatus TaxID=30207 RepID=UPI001CA90379|nr:uncharacterized protein LOC122513553 [Polistes fuscatus]
MLYYTMLLYQTIEVLMVTVIGSLSLSSFLVFIQHACCQCSIIKIKIRQPFAKYQQAGQNTKYFNTLTEEYNWISDIVNRHRISIEYVEMLRYVSNVVYLILILLAMILFMFNFLCVSPRCWK